MVTNDMSHRKQINRSIGRSINRQTDRQTDRQIEIYFNVSQCDLNLVVEIFPLSSTLSVPLPIGGIAVVAAYH